MRRRLNGRLLPCRRLRSRRLRRLRGPLRRRLPLLLLLHDRRGAACGSLRLCGGPGCPVDGNARGARRGRLRRGAAGLDRWPGLRRNLRRNLAGSHWRSRLRRPPPWQSIAWGRPRLGLGSLLPRLLGWLRTQRRRIRNRRLRRTHRRRRTPRRLACSRIGTRTGTGRRPLATAIPAWRLIGRVHRRSPAFIRDGLPKVTVSRAEVSRAPGEPTGDNTHGRRFPSRCPFHS